MADSHVDWYIDQVHGRMDHVGNIESEESDIFLIAAQQVLLQAIDRKDEFVRQSDIGPTDDLVVIYANFLSGLQQMIHLAEKEDVVFWTSRYQKDCDNLVDAIRRFRLGPQHPDYFHPRHRRERQRDKLFHLNWQRKQMRQRLATLGPDKAMKRFIHELKDRPEV
ncbi:MAG: hypothetical protein NTV51_30595 [Verrucomicrobia bacterium]|nr:hypothetical protein [Verrucomicrobiota bacterium]